MGIRILFFHKNQLPLSLRSKTSKLSEFFLPAWDLEKFRIMKKARARFPSLNFNNFVLFF